MVSQVSVLRGSCACDRNQYQIELPQESIALASVFFDNSAQSRKSEHCVLMINADRDLSGRPQASPVTAWLRIPLDYYHSFTIAQFPDETHATIRRTYTTPLASSTIQTTRRQFCGYCGTHLTAFDESQQSTKELIDVTLGSLLDESLDRLQTLKILPDDDDDADEDEQEDGRVKGGSIDDETHIPTTALQEQKKEELPASTPHAEIRNSISRYMQHRGIPYFEEMIENSSLGRIRRQKGGHTSEDGRTKVHWEVIEFDGDETMENDGTTSDGNAAKRVKLDA